MASIAVLPVLIGLAVDYAIQFQARFGEARRGGARRRGRRGGGRRPRRPVIATAALATPPASSCCCSRRSRWSAPSGCCCGGHRVAFVLALTAGLAALSLTATRPAVGGRPAAPLAARLSGVRRRRAPALRLRGCAKRVRSASRSPRPARVLAAACSSPRAAGRRAPAPTSSPTSASCCPRDLPALQDVDQLQEETGVSGEVDVTVDAPDLTDPAVIAWMRDFQQRVLERRGLRSGRRPCASRTPSSARRSRCPTSSAASRARRAARIRRCWSCCRPYFSQAVVTARRDRRARQHGDDPRSGSRSCRSTSRRS